MASSPVKTASESSDTPLESTPTESNLSSDSPPEVCADHDGDRSPAALAKEQQRGLEELWDKRETKYERIMVEFANRRYRTHEYCEGQIFLAKKRYENGVGFCTLRLFFGRFLKREIKKLKEKERNGMAVLLEGAKIELGAVTKEYDYLDYAYIRQCKIEWGKRYPVTPFWYDNEDVSSSDGYPRSTTRSSTSTTRSSTTPQSFV
ncbi:hypothetical protein LX32DRAFT_648714 [Colletotrichum zoysiae]|uniref:Uncharacterized protein n=1 Tax=Colletotrichum zoysiae TaxID=1216348 RepID=A0AAD9HRI7_9PEZI|nr:hypothetical protein LX32DRAFT_648714 [Colletotrichum zoysiae]